MDAALFTKMLSDKSITDLKKLRYKYPNVDMKEFIHLLRSSMYNSMPIDDFNGNRLTYLDGFARVRMNTVRLLAASQGGGSFGFHAMEDEIASTLTIEDIDFSRDSVRKILRGYAPEDESEDCIFGLKRGLEFISEPENPITEKNIHTLYKMAIETYLQESDRLEPGALYRHDKVYVVSQELEHTGLPHERLAKYMKQFVDFINEESEIDDLLKAAVIHFYIAYLHPWFDSNVTKINPYISTLSTLSTFHERDFLFYPNSIGA